MEERLGVTGTGDCYEVAGHTIVVEDWAEDALLCHGTAVGQGPLQGQPVDHAWVELGDVVFDQANGLDIVLRRERYYEIGQIKSDRVRRYTKQEATEKMLKTGHYGPWDDD